MPRRRCPILSASRILGVNVSHLRDRYSRYHMARGVEDTIRVLLQVLPAAVVCPQIRGQTHGYRSSVGGSGRSGRSLNDDIQIARKIERRCQVSINAYATKDDRLSDCCVPLYFPRLETLSTPPACTRTTNLIMDFSAPVDSAFTKALPKVEVCVILTMI